MEIREFPCGPERRALSLLINPPPLSGFKIVFTSRLGAGLTGIFRVSKPGNIPEVPV